MNSQHSTSGSRRPIAPPRADLTLPPVEQPALERPLPATSPLRPTPVPQRPLPTGPAQPVGPVGNRPILAPRAAGQLETAPEEQSEQDDLKELVREAPAWMISLLVHMSLFIVLGVWAGAALVAPHKEIVAVVDQPSEEIFAETLGEQLIDDRVNYEVLDAQAASALSITPQNLPPVADPLAAPPMITAVGPGGLFAGSDIAAPQIGLALSGRQSGSSKNMLLGKYGGTKTTEASVTSGLKWLVKQQKSDGSWSLQGPYADGGQDENILSATAMALLAFQGAGNTHQKGEFAKQVAKGWAFLSKQQRSDGDFFTGGPAHHRLYTQAQCSIALCELYGMTKDSVYRDPSQRATNYAVRIQDSGGGWRYQPGSESDTSVTGWFVMALQSARMAKLDVPQSTLDNIMRYLDSAQEEGGRRYAYTPGTFVTPAVTAEGLLCREYLGWKQNDPRLVEGVRALNQNPVNYQGADPDVYYWYYATQAAHHLEGQIWEDWNRVMRQEVPAHQVTGGAEAGSWNPRGDKWGSYGGRLYVTCLSIYMLEVYYRHLPIYTGFRHLAGEN